MTSVIKKINSPRKKYSLFETPVWHFSGDLVDGAYDWALKIQKNTEGVWKSNVGGYQSMSTHDWTDMKYDQHIIKRLDCLPKFQFANWWLNINKKGDSNDYHTHPDSMLSGVWYITDNYGSIEFQHPLLHNRNGILENEQSYITLNCTAGDILVFPSDLVHRVLPHTEDTRRISVSFNMVKDVPIAYKQS